MKIFLVSMLAGAMLLSGAVSAADKENSTQSSPTAMPEVEKIKPAETRKSVTRPAKPRGKDLDFRHCLELEDNAMIAQCAQE